MQQIPHHNQIQDRGVIMKVRHAIFLAMALGTIIGVAVGRWEGFLLGGVPFAICISFIAFPTLWINLGFSFAFIPIAVIAHNEFNVSNWASELVASTAGFIGMGILVIVFLFWKFQPHTTYKLSFPEAYRELRFAFKEGIRDSLKQDPVYLFPNEENQKKLDYPYSGLPLGR